MIKVNNFLIGCAIAFIVSLIWFKEDTIIGMGIFTIGLYFGANVDLDNQ